MEFVFLLFSLDKQQAKFEVASETYDKTMLGQLESGHIVNLEPALRLGDSLDGHLVSGHVDCVTEVKAIERQDDKTVRFQFFAA